jgi:hypothetical protein
LKKGKLGIFEDRKKVCRHEEDMGSWRKRPIAYGRG